MEPFIGQIQPFGFNFAPRGWAMCDGQLLPISQYSALFSLLGTTYGGDGRTTFALPDLRGRAALHMGNGPGLSDHRIGAKGGSEKTTINITNMPSHNHIATAAGTMKVNSAAGEQDDPVGAVPATASNDNYSDSANALGLANSVDVAVTIQNNGGQQPFNNMQPYLVINWCIALQGIFPSRS